MLAYFVIGAANQLFAQLNEISFRIKNAGQVFVAVYDNQGRMLRELARGMKLQPGQHHFFWDRLERYGKPAPAGEYEW